MDWDWKACCVNWKGIEFMDSGPTQHTACRPKTKIPAAESTAPGKAGVWARSGEPPQTISANDFHEFEKTMDMFMRLVEIFGFELEDASQAPKNLVSDGRSAKPRENGFRMGCYRNIRDRG